MLHDLSSHRTVFGNARSQLLFGGTSQPADLSATQLSKLSCSFRNHYQELQALESEFIGLSVQTTDYQTEMADRLHLPFPVVSDANYEFQKAMNMPTFVAAGMTLLKRVTLICEDGVIKAIHCPIFPSGSDPAWVIDYLKGH